MTPFKREMKCASLLLAQKPTLIYRLSETRYDLNRFTVLRIVSYFVSQKQHKARFIETILRDSIRRDLSRQFCAIV
jgi:hypothetical protein